MNPQTPFLEAAAGSVTLNASAFSGTPLIVGSIALLGSVFIWFVVFLVRSPVSRWEKVAALALSCMAVAANILRICIML